MDTKSMINNTRLAGYTAIIGAVTMVIGAALWGSSGTDLWAALDNNDVAGYLVAAGALKGQLVANLSLWILGVLILGVAGMTMANICTQRRLLAQIAAFCIRTAVPLVIVSYIVMLSLLVQLGPDTSPTAVAIANVVGWIGVRADDIATALMIGAGPFFFALAARDEWMPSWLAWWGYLTGAIGLFSLVVLYIAPLRSLGFIIIPIGVAWTIAAGIVLLRRDVKQEKESGIGLSQVSKKAIS